MKKFTRRIIPSVLIIFLCVVAFCGSYCKGYYCYADTVHLMSDEELEAAYQAYLQSKGGGLIGDVGARTAYMSGKLLNFISSDANTTGIQTIDALKSQLAWDRQHIEGKDSKDILKLSVTPGGYRFLSLYTQWLLQNKYLGNNASLNNDGMFNDNVEDNLYSGELFTDDDGNTCLVFIVTNTFNSNMQSSNSYFDNYIVKYGTPLKYTTQEIVHEASLKSSYPSEICPITINGQTFIIPNVTYEANNGDFTYYVMPTYSYPQYIIYGKNSDAGSVVKSFNGFGYRCIYRKTNNDNLYLGMYHRGSYLRNNNANEKYYCGVLTGSDRVTRNNNTENVNVIFYTNNNNNISVYPTDIDANGTLNITPKLKVGLEYQPYVINEGDTINNIVNNYYGDSGDKDKTIAVPDDGTGGGSGGGNDNPDTPDNPSGGTPPNWSNPYPSITQDSDGVFNFNFHLPDLNIDWSIDGLKEKFPFSIPFDLIEFVKILDAEPETPHFTGTVNLVIYQWQIDADLSAFDNLASIVRNVEFIGFCIGLILITRKMIKG